MTTRRRFLKTGALTVAGLGSGLLPGILRAQQAPGILTVKNPNAKLQLAVIGCGGIANSHVSNHARNEMLIALSDVYQDRIDGKLENITKMEDAAVKAADVQQFLDYRELLETLGDTLDGVSIATPDHNHAIITLDSIRRGKHVLVEKPMAHNIAEAVAMRDAAREAGVATQMGNQGHMGGGIVMAVNYLRSGFLGPVREVYHWCQRTIGGGAEGVTTSLRETLDDDYRLWSVPATEDVARVDYNRSAYTGPRIGRPSGGWRSDRRWGTGSLGDWGCHTLDPAFWGLMIEQAPQIQVECLEQMYGSEYFYHKTNAIRWTIPPRGDMPECAVYWYDGARPGEEADAEEQNLPPKVVEIYEKHGRKPPEFGAMFIGEKGVMLTGGHAQFGGFLPTDLRAEMPGPPQTVPEGTGSKFSAWYHAMRTGEPAAASFEYSAGLTEFVLTGVMAETAGPGKPFTYDMAAHRVTDREDLNSLLTRPYRSGFELA